MNDAAILTPGSQRTAPRAHSGTAHIRPLAESDLEPVAELFLQRFRDGGGGAKARAEIALYMKRLYLDYPTRDGDPASLVAIDAYGDLGGFAGCLPAPFHFDGRPIKAGVSGTLMASPAPHHGFAAVRLLRESRGGGVDLLFTDTANRASLAMCQAMDYVAVAPDCLEWAFVFKPAELVLQKAARRLRLGWLNGFRPLARAADRAAGPALKAALGEARSDDWRDAPADPEVFIGAASRLMEGCRFAPRYGAQEFSWLLGMAAQRRSAGPLNLRVVCDGRGQPVGAYAGYGGKGDVARIFFLIAAPNAWGRLLAKMIETARAAGCVAIHGPMRKRLAPHVYATRGAFLYYACGTLAYARPGELREAVEAGEALLGGFAGDRWTRLASDAFG